MINGETARQSEIVFFAQIVEIYTNLPFFGENSNFYWGKNGPSLGSSHHPPLSCGVPAEVFRQAGRQEDVAVFGVPGGLRWQPFLGDGEVPTNCCEQ